jgi:hypothetical protein
VQRCELPTARSRHALGTMNKTITGYSTLRPLSNLHTGIHTKYGAEKRREVHNLELFIVISNGLTLSVRLNQEVFNILAM